MSAADVILTSAAAVGLLTPWGLIATGRLVTPSRRRDPISDRLSSRLAHRTDTTADAADMLGTPPPRPVVQRAAQDGTRHDPQHGELWTREHAAAYLGVSVRTVRRLGAGDRAPLTEVRQPHPQPVLLTADSVRLYALTRAADAPLAAATVPQPAASNGHRP